MSLVMIRASLRPWMNPGNPVAGVLIKLPSRASPNRATGSHVVVVSGRWADLSLRGNSVEISPPNASPANRPEKRHSEKFHIAQRVSFGTLRGDRRRKYGHMISQP